MRTAHAGVLSAVPQVHGEGGRFEKLVPQQRLCGVRELYTEGGRDGKLGRYLNQSRHVQPQRAAKKGGNDLAQ